MSVAKITEKLASSLLALMDGRGIAGDADSSALSFAQFAERYLAQHAAGRKKPRPLAEDRRNLDRYILPSLGDLRLYQITRRDVAAFHAAQHTRPIMGNRCLSLISHIFTIAEKWELRPVGSNPCRGLDRYPERPRERMLDTTELARLGKLLGFGAAAAPTCLERSKPEDWRVIACLKLLILTGARLGEVLSLQWNWINWDRGIARLPDSKTGPKNLPLPGQALDLLSTLKNEHHIRGDCKFVLPGHKSGTHFQGIHIPWQRIREAASLQGVRIHDLRHCYASVAVAGGESLYMVGSILGHRSVNTTQRYAHLASEPIRDAANRTAARLSKLLDPSEDLIKIHSQAKGIDNASQGLPPSCAKPVQERSP
jgi:integrase